MRSRSGRSWDVEIANLQSGVVSRRQLNEAGCTDRDIRRLIRRRELVAIHRGVYIDHTGEPTWHQRAWAAVLAVWPAALCGTSALRAYENAGEDGTIHVAVDVRRNVAAPIGVEVHRRAGLSDCVAWNLSPPRLRYEESVIDVATQQRRDVDAVAVLANAVGSRRTTARRLRAALDARPRIRHRTFVADVLGDIASGTWSVLEHGYLDRVERPHALPAGRRQFRHVSSAGVQYRDVDLEGLVVIELDGRLHHASSRQRDRDLERDLDTAVEGRHAIRLGWGQVFERPCSTAGKVWAILASGGWGGGLAACGPTCTAAEKKVEGPSHHVTGTLDLLR